MSKSTIAIVTGANKGIGYAIVKQIVLQYPRSSYAQADPSRPLLVYLTARNAERGQEAVRALYEDSQLRAQGLGEGQGSKYTIKYHPMDISEPSSIDGIATFMKKEHQDGIDILVNNAGIALQGFDESVVRDTLATNYSGTLHSSLNFLPLIRKGGRLVNVASLAGKIQGKYPATLQDQFRDAQSIEDVDKLAQTYQRLVQQGKHSSEGWPSAAYSVSKALVIAFTRVLARDPSHSGITINSCCPGYVATDMTKMKGVKSVEDGAQTPTFLALHDLKGQTGLFWENEKPSEW